MKITEETRNASYDKLDNETMYKRIKDILKTGERLTAREISERMYVKKYIPFPVRQAVAPRLTELESKGQVEVCCKVYDKITERYVAAYRLVDE